MLREKPTHCTATVQPRCRCYHRGTSKNSRQSSDATKLPPTDSALFPFRFMDVHSCAVRDRRREQFFEVPKEIVLVQFTIPRRPTITSPPFANCNSIIGTDRFLSALPESCGLPT